MELHQETNKDLSHTVDDQEIKNARLKQRIVDLEDALNPHPLFSKSLAIVQPVEESPSQACKIDKITHLLSGVRSFVEQSIKERVDLISEAFKVL